MLPLFFYCKFKVENMKKFKDIISHVDYYIWITLEPISDLLDLDVPENVMKIMREKNAISRDKSKKKRGGKVG